MKKLKFFLLAIFVVCLSPIPLHAETNVYRLSVDGAIGPATSDYLLKGIEQAEAAGAQMLVIEMNTPGGLDTAMREIIQAILDSEVPIATYVSPKGARAASAGTYILYASHIAAMAPATNLGSATPVSIGGISPTPGGQQDQPSPPDDMRNKVLNDAIGYIRGLAQLRGRNEQWAVKAVQEAANLPANDALKEKVIDFVAEDIHHLIEQANGKQVKVRDQMVTLTFKNPVIVDVTRDWKNRLLDAISSPNVAYILLMVGIWGIILEFYQPGGMVAGIVGAICLLIAFYSFQMLPINLAAAGLIVLGIGLIIAEAYAPSFGALGIGGLIALVLGSFMLIESDLPQYQISTSLLISVSVVSTLITGAIIFLAYRSYEQPQVTGDEELFNSVATAVKDFQGKGRVYLRGEVWQAHCEQPVSKGQKLKVTAVEGLTVTVTPEEN